MIPGLGMHASSVLTFILERGNVKKTALQEIISKPATADRTVRKLAEFGLIMEERTKLGRVLINISLPRKGRKVTDGFRLIESTSAELPDYWNEKWRELPTLFHVNVLGDRIKVKETSYGCLHIGYAMVLKLVQEFFLEMRERK